ncbi:hypothetical protein CVT24_006387 [Panaeolus cyanescens]|uniref:Reverse transcriptase domain-containing protein n=1 Tax=Panaeolus cyanescens TaxID=181874 RepID=A0A409WI46_9AGAR|nr:hypothetical protein CVT24_006387 [Panaeolus cyanescens]
MVTLMRKERIAIMACQETHITDGNVDAVQQANPKVTIIHSGSRTNAAGVAFVLNNDLVKPKEIVHTELIVGRAARLRVCLEDDFGLDMINVYSPNEAARKKDFYKELKGKLCNQVDMSEPILMGDFNVVMEEIDRSPMHGDQADVVQELEGLLGQHRWIDGWREHNKDKLDYTYYQKGSASMSRIDRIYTNKDLATYAFNWGIIDSADLSDHLIMSVEIMKKFMPFIGKGTWKLGTSLLEDRRYMNIVRGLLREAEKDIKELRAVNEVGIQKRWNTLKRDVRSETQEYQREKRRELTREKRNLENALACQLSELKKERTRGSNVRLRERIKQTRKRLQERSRSHIDKLRREAKANYLVEGERCTKYWFNLNKEKYKKQIIYGLIDEKDRLQLKTTDMNKVATKYHRELQARPEMTAGRRAAVNVMKGGITRVLDHDQKEMLERGIGAEEVIEALKQAANGSSPGADGITYEFYKKWAEKPKTGEREDKPDIVGMLTAVYEEIERVGIIENKKDDSGHFADGVMCLLYKKNDKRKVENYRPITLLNTDYKLYTKTLTNRLNQVAGTILHENQAGFVPGRSLYDHTRNTHVAIDYCEIMEVNGCIVALDQEKAYDKIDHDYLWEVLEGFGFPEAFRNKVKELYKDTTKRILVNGVIGEHIEVKRGVHQGDPLSCLLYDIAIEPLAERLRSSGLEGIQAGNNIEKLLVNLFADDTLVYLGEGDSLEELNSIIEVFCTASTAKFNLQKTEYLPVGTKEWRTKVVEEQAFNGTAFQEGTRVVKDGDAMRTLGVWVGNGVTVTDKWDKILEKQKKIMKEWAKCHLSFRGKELVIKALVQSRAVFAATVDGIDDATVEKMVKQYKSFLWDGKKALMKWETVIRPRKQGGLNMPDLKTRIEAIEIMWIKRWQRSEGRPPWAEMMEDILFRNAKGSAVMHKRNQGHWILQDWDIKKIGNKNIPVMMESLIRTARKYNISFQPLRMTERMRRDLPLFHSISIKGMKHQLGKKPAGCLSRGHRIRTLGALVDSLEGPQPRNVCRKKECKKMANRLGELLPEYVDPRQTTPEPERSHGVEMSPDTRTENRKRRRSAICDADYRDDGRPLDAVRIGQREPGAKSMTEHDFKRRRQVEPLARVEEEVVIDRKEVLAGVALRNEGYDSGTAAIAIGIDGATFTQRVTGPVHRERILVLAIIKAIQMVGNNMPVMIRTRSGKAVQMAAEGMQLAEDVNWVGVENKDEWRQVLRLVRARNARTEIELVTKEHPLDGPLRGVEQEAKDNLARDEPAEDLMDTSDDKWDKKGARLQALTQRTAYAMIIEGMDNDVLTEITKNNIATTQDAIEEVTGRRPEEESIWNGTALMRNKKIADFVWKMVHQRIRCGKYFRNIPTMVESEFCSCAQTESIEHILCECATNGNGEMWDYMQEVWEKTHPHVGWVRPSGRLIRGIGAVEVAPKDLIHIHEMYRLMVGTAAWCIWKERNNRVFNGEPCDVNRIKNMWHKEMKEQAWADNARIKKLGAGNKKTKFIAKVQRFWCNNGALATMDGGQLRDGDILRLEYMHDV